MVRCFQGVVRQNAVVTVHLRKHQHDGPARIAYEVNNGLIGALAVLMCWPHGQLPMRFMEVDPVGEVLGPTGICNATQLRSPRSCCREGLVEHVSCEATLFLEDLEFCNAIHQRLQLGPA